MEGHNFLKSKRGQWITHEEEERGEEMPYYVIYLRSAAPHITCCIERTLSIHHTPNIVINRFDS
jgi:hypothetical protein